MILNIWLSTWLKDYYILPSFSCKAVAFVVGLILNLEDESMQNKRWVV